MRRELLNFFPSWAVFFVIVGAVILFALIIYKVSRRYFPKYLMSGSINASNIFLDIITISTILLAFTIVVLWQFYMSTKEAVGQEAAAISRIVIYSKALSYEEQHYINKAIGNYLNIVVNREWPLMREGKTSIEAESAIDGLYLAIERYSPANNDELIFYQEALHAFNDVLLARDKRVEAIDSIVPNTFFFVIVINLLLLVAAICLIQEKEKKSEYVFITFVSVIVGINLSLILIMDYPFSGEFQVSSTPFMQGILESIYDVNTPYR